MDYKRGGTLRELIRQQKSLVEPLCKLLARQMLTGLIHMHEMDIIHRDINPQNIFLEKKTSSPDNMKISIGDFGFAMSLGKKQNEWRCGTPSYMAPEVISRALYTTKSDVYSMGCLLYIMLTGDHLYNGFSQRETILMNMKGNFKKNLEKLQTTISPLMMNFMLSILEVDHTKRLSSKEAFSHPWLN